MSKEKFSPEFVGGVQLQSAQTGLTLAFQKKYGDDAVKITQTFVEQLGTRMGNNFKEKIGITGSETSDIENIFHTWLDTALAPLRLNTVLKAVS